MRRKLILFILLMLSIGLSAQNAKMAAIDKNKKQFKEAFNEQLEMLQGKRAISPKRAVFLTENAYHNGSLNYNSFNKQIDTIVRKLRYNIKLNGFERYKTAGNWAVFTFLKEPNALNKFKPYEYDFDDFNGEKDYSSMFVSKLLNTKKGNCCSFPLLYKILCDELGAEAFLATAPHHFYIKHRDDDGQWTNVELTNGSFPKDQWIIQQLFVSVEAIKQGTYMSPLSDKENIVMCMHSLSSSYKFKYGYDNFVEQIADSALSYFPNNMQMLMTKANCLLFFGETELKKEHKDTVFLKTNYKTYKEYMRKINSIGYSDMPEGQYEDLMKSIENEKKRKINKL